MCPDSRSRSPLSRDEVVAETRTLIEDEGLDALSLRRLADRLGVTAPALYAHVAGKDDLVRAVTDGELDQIIEHLRPASDDPVDCLRTFCRDYVAYALAHPHLYRALYTHPPWRGMAGALDEATGGESPGADGDAGPAPEIGPEAGSADPYVLAVRTSRFKAIYDTAVEAVETGAFRPVEPMVALLVLWTAVHGLVEVLLLDVVPSETARRRLTEELIDTTIAGLRNPDGPSSTAIP